MNQRRAREAIETLLELWGAERQASLARFREERDATPLAERLSQGHAWRAAVTEVDAAPGERTRLWLRGAGVPRELAFRPGTPVELSADDQRVRGVWERARSDDAAVVVGGEPATWLLDEQLLVEPADDSATFDRGERALRALVDPAPKSFAAGWREALWGRPPEPWEPAPLATDELDPELNGPQREAVAHALGAPRLALIHGPPGTGKTRTLAEVVVQAVARGQRVLACAASNAAVDNLTERLVGRGLSVVRLGHPARVSPAVEAHGLDAQVAASDDYALARGWIAEAHALRQTLDKRWKRRAIPYAERRAGLAEVRKLLRDARAHLSGLKDAIVNQAQVVCATAAGADSELLAEAEFDLVALDEATQAVDPIALVALLRAPRAVLAGDPCQLPPTVIDLHAADRGLRVSFFERLAAAAPSACRLLTVQYRMPTELMRFPSAQHYGGALEADPSVATQRLADLPAVAADPLRPEPWCFLDTAGKGWEETRLGDDPSLCNPEQAARVAAEVERLLGRGVAPRDLGVICAYAAEVRLLRARLAGPVGQGLEVSSVDGFQGREKEAIVVDLVRSNPDARIGFLSDTRRTNVALTRARRFLLVVGDSATLSPHAYYAALLEAADRDGAYLSAWADEAPPFDGPG